MNNLRVFPRYEVESLESVVILPTLHGQSMVLKNISLGGLKLHSSQEILTFNEIEIRIQTLGDRRLDLKGIQVWKKFEEDRKHYSAGFTLKFESKSVYQGWITLIKAVHNIKAKNYFA